MPGDGNTSVTNDLPARGVLIRMKPLLLFFALAFSLSLVAEEPPGILLARQFAKKLEVEVGSVAPSFPDRGILVRSKVNGRTAVLLAHPKDQTYELFGVAAPQPPLELPAKASDEAIAAAVRAMVKKAHASDEFSGVVLIARGDRIVLHEGFGIAERDHNVPVEPLTKFQIASVGKMFTATAIMQLIDAGKLTLDTTLLEALPDYPNREVAAKVRIRHLLNHSAGMGGFSIVRSWNGSAAMSATPIISRSSPASRCSSSRAPAVRTATRATSSSARSSRS